MESMSAVGFEPTSANTVELESTPLDRSGTLTMKIILLTQNYTHASHTHAYNKHHTISSHTTLPSNSSPRFPSLTHPLLHTNRV
jgi:hypothetical protein